jgi:hypothetical protein
VLYVQRNLAGHKCGGLWVRTFTMNTNMKKIQRRIMRRVYTIFAARVVSSPITLNSALFVAALMVFAEVVHVQRIIEGLTSHSFASLPSYIFNAVMRGEVITLTAIGVMIFTALSIQWQVRGVFLPKMQQAFAKA